MSNKVLQNIGISHGPYIDISLAKRGPWGRQILPSLFFDPPPSPLCSLSKSIAFALNLFGVNYLGVLVALVYRRFVS